MPTFKFAKLVRDNIVDHQIASGATPRFHILNDAEHKAALVDKMIEEVREIATADPDEVAAEIADVQQAIDDLKEKCGLTDADIAKAQASKNDKNGPFKKGIFVESVTVDEGNTWTQYYRKHADRYPEM